MPFLVAPSLSDDEMASVTGKNAHFHYAHSEYTRRNRCVARRKSSVRTLLLTPSSETSERARGGDYQLIAHTVPCVLSNTCGFSRIPAILDNQ